MIVAVFVAELRRRHPEFRKFEVMQQRREEEHEDEEDEMEESVPMISRSNTRESSFDDSRTDFENVDVTEDIPDWLQQAEDLVRKHLGQGRCSHDYLHADRLRRQAVNEHPLCLVRLPAYTV